jgi:glycosyltransferase involved in cell wall biosynthesis
MINFWFRKDKNHITGGDIYNRMVFDALKKRGFQVSARNGYLRCYQGRGSTYIDSLYTFLMTGSKAGDIDLMDYRVAMSCSGRHRGKRMIILFHYDINETRKKRKQRFFFRRFLKNAREAKLIVIAQCWKTFLESWGLTDIDIVYCAYDVAAYRPYLSRRDFLKRFDLPDKPIIYLGKNSIPKTLKAYQIVKELETDYLLVTTGPRREFKGPLHLDLNFAEYSSLLHWSGVTLLLPRFAEGWSRIAHESIICGTPVIGNGCGGMKELLMKTRQTVLPENDPAAIRQQIRRIISSRQRVEEQDALYARQFDLDYFARRWEEILQDFIPEPNPERSS